MIIKMNLVSKLEMDIMRKCTKKYWKQSLNQSRNYLLAQDYRMLREGKSKLPRHLKVISLQGLDLEVLRDQKNSIISQGRTKKNMNKARIKL